MKNPQLAILVLCFNSKKYLKTLFKSLNNQSYKNTRIYFLDNNSTDGSIELVQNAKFKVQSYSLKLKIIRYKKNFGYAAGNNIGLEKAFNDGADLCLLLNPDIILKKDTVANLVKTYQEKKQENIKVGLIQPVILLENDKLRINSIGNAFHYLGFGYCQDFYKKFKQYKNDKEIISVSGAAMLVSKDYFQNVGGFDESFFMICEDQDLCLRGLLFGYRHYLSSRSILYHHYEYGRHKLHKYYEEKNRLMILLKNYSIKSLILLAPILFLNEIAIVSYSIFEGWIFLKLKTYLIILRNLKNIIKNRQIIQRKRIVKDKVLFSQFKTSIYFKPINNFITKYVANFVYELYYKLINIFI